MTINQFAPRVHVSSRFLSLSGAVGVGYALSWVAGLSVPAPNPAFHASGQQIIAAYAGHGAAAALQFALTEGLPAAGIAVISVTLARTLRSRIAGVVGLTAAAISLVQFLLGLALTAAAAPGAAHLLFAAVNRLDGVKLLLFAALGAAAALAGRRGAIVRRSGMAAARLPRWLRWTGAAMAVAMTASGLVYLLLLSGLVLLAGPALVLLLVFMAGAGLTLARS